MIGVTLGNRYVIEEKIGVGGMAVVFKARDTLLNRYVAVKILKNEFMDDDEFLKKFAMEAQSAASLSHQNIVSVYDVGSSVIDEKKYNYIVMEYVDGRTLKDIIKEKAPLDSDYISNIGFQIASAIEAAHKNGVIHRDIKPQNILIDKNNIAKVTDFGIARISASATITYTSTVLGTVHYISPEQAKGKFIDEKSDIYSLGVVLYEMATGQVPFEAENAVGIALKHIQDPLVEPKSLNPKLPVGLNEIIIKAMDKEPNNRFINATEFKIALLNYRNYTPELSDGFEKTERIGVIKDEDLEEIEENRATYAMPKGTDKEENFEETPKKIFSTYILPIILAIIVASAIFVGYKVVGSGLFSKDTIKTPSLVGLTEKEAKKELESYKFDLKLEVLGTKTSNYEKDKIYEQNPKSDTKIKKGSTIGVFISEGEGVVTIPTGIIGSSIERAEKQIKDLDLEPVSIEEFSDEYPEGTIISINPSEGVKIKLGSKVELTVSKGKEEKINLLDVTEIDVERATKMLNDQGLKVSIKKEYSNTVAEGKVISQSEKAGTKVEKGKEITLVISLGKTVPEVIDYTFTIDPSEIPTERYNVTIDHMQSLTTPGAKNDQIYSGDFAKEDGIKKIKQKVVKGDFYQAYINGKPLGKIKVQ